MLENLSNKYKAKTALNFTKLKGHFTNSKLANSKDDPDEWITHLEALRTWKNEVQIVGKSTKSDTDLVLHILANVPEAYKNQLNELEAVLKKDPSTVTNKMIHKKLNGRLVQVHKSREMASGNDPLSIFLRSLIPEIIHGESPEEPTLVVVLVWQFPPDGVRYFCQRMLA